MLFRIAIALRPYFLQKIYKSIGLGRWNTQVNQKIKDRRTDLANIDSCGDEVCANPQKLSKLYPDRYYVCNLKP